ncbi:hypothetical protein CRX42_02345 [Pseudomonas jessenii]|uniref:Phage tail collar domain-containing protein n=2 Tax=Pseudomonas jessenii TaxID=77298 RepID=A0A2W0FG72_PSEJE|nr:hypothetical protein CRX42_02345 [Pseudomonas jessenii]
MVAHSGVPSMGWLKCNGALLVRASYPRLFAMIGTAHNTGGETSLQFRLPDFRGEFLRGFDDGRGVDISRVFGSFQGYMVEGHNHYLPTSSGTPGEGYGIDDTAFTKCLPNQVPVVPVPSTTYPNPLYENPSLTGSMGSFGTETRPRNKVVSYWIKY